MGEGRDRGLKFGRIIIDARARWKLTRHEAGARRRTKRTGAIGIGEPYAFFRKLLQMRRFKKRSRTVREPCAIELIDHDDQNIGLRLRHSETLYE